MLRVVPVRMVGYASRDQIERVGTS